MKKIIQILILSFIIWSCDKSKPAEKIVSKETTFTDKYALDTHSFAKPNEAVAKHLDLDIDVDFTKKIITGKASYHIEKKANAKFIHFDSKALVIKKVTINESLIDSIQRETSFNVIKGDQIHGDDLTITLPKNTKTVHIYYETTHKTEALQFLSKQQTADKKNPFLFTQGQAILTRTWIPIQDSPQLRLTYNARVTVPNNLMAVMSAKNPKEKSKNGVYNFTMKQAISPYLIALAVGDIVYVPLSERTGVYAEPSLIKKVASEFEDTEKMMLAAENLYGKYNWEQYDIIVLPPSFPFGGMENPRLTFATPTIIAGDKSLTTLIAHELAHSWSGNLVTNATWDDFWLNEGFTVYFERRIMEAVYGKDYANMLAVIGRQDLDEGLENLKDTPNDTKLKLNLNGRTPDDGMTDIAYEKGFLFLKTLEEKVGREKMDKFLKNYFSKHAFLTITTEKFITYLNKNLLLPNKIDFNTNQWIYEAGIPSNQVKITSDKFEIVMQTIEKWKNNEISVKNICGQDWAIQQKIHFIRNIPITFSAAHLQTLDAHCEYTSTTNSYIAMVWFEQTIKHNYQGSNVTKKIEHFLTNVGRRWYVSTIYRALKNNGRLKEALRIYKKARPNYHSVTVGTIDELLGFDE
ncbi:MAG: M1 family metallopeptidase [Flavobacteriaceae bacterium]|nr:M1 family metallopeptidase [Flavobacteriaceae bacterium]